MRARRVDDAVARHVLDIVLFACDRDDERRERATRRARRGAKPTVLLDERRQIAVVRLADVGEKVVRHWSEAARQLGSQRRRPGATTRLGS